MIPIPSGVRVWIATGHTDMRRGMNGLALQAQQALKRDPHAGDLFVFRGRRGNLVKVLWHDSLGMSLYAKRLERGKFIWPSPADGAVVITPAQLAYMLECQSASNFDPRSASKIDPLRSSFVHCFGKRLQSCVAGSIPLFDGATIPSSRPTSFCASRAGAVQDDA